MPHGRLWIWLALTLLGCDDAKPKSAVEDNSCGDATGAGLASCLPTCPDGQVLDLFTASCASQCSLAFQVTQRVPGEKTVDCGTLDFTALVAMRQQAEQCVLGAVASGRPFRYIQWQRGTDSRVGTAWLAPGAGQLMSILQFDGGPSGGGLVGDTIAEQTCRSLRVASGCQVTMDSSCLECEDAIESSIACDDSVRPADQGCHEAGNYQVGKEGGYLPCCTGLREVFQLEATEQGDTSGTLTPVCDQPIGYRNYACVQGRCGDGVCEDAESVPCGCPLDCASARLGDAGT